MTHRKRRQRARTIAALCWCAIVCPISICVSAGALCILLDVIVAAPAGPIWWLCDFWWVQFVIMGTWAILRTVTNAGNSVEHAVLRRLLAERCRLPRARVVKIKSRRCRASFQSEKHSHLFVT